MRGDEYGVEEWLPGGLAVRAPAADEADGAQFIVDGPSRSVHALPAEGGKTTVDLNEVDFEGLIGLGISVGQAARFISQRERRGGIRALSELDGYHGLAPSVRDILRWSGNV